MRYLTIVIEVAVKALSSAAQLRSMSWDNQPYDLQVNTNYETTLGWIYEKSKSSIFFSNRKSLCWAVFYDAANGCVLPPVLIDFVNLVFLSGRQPKHKKLSMRDFSSDNSILLTVMHRVVFMNRSIQKKKIYRSRFSWLHHYTWAEEHSRLLLHKMCHTIHNFVK